METSHGSQNLAGAGPHALAIAQTVLQAAALVAVWVALGKVLSPQFLIWLIPIVPLVRGRRGVLASGLLAVALVLTQLWFPFRYWDLANHFDVAPSWLVLARDVLLVALAVVLALPSTAERAGQAVTRR